MAASYCVFVVLLFYTAAPSLAKPQVPTNEPTKTAKRSDFGGTVGDMAGLHLGELSGGVNYASAAGYGGFAGAGALGAGVYNNPNAVDGVAGAGDGTVHGMGYFSQECNSEKKCEEGKWCDMGLCVDMLLENIACTREKQCGPDLVCTYGKCLREPNGGRRGAPGTFCEKSSDCTWPTATKGCCVLVPAINPLKRICIPRLESDQFCGLHHIFGHSDLHRNLYSNEDDACNPCIDGYECKNRGNFAPHMVCAAKPAAKRGDDRGTETKADAKQDEKKEEKKEEKKVARTITEDIKAALKPKKDSGKGI